MMTPEEAIKNFEQEINQFERFEKINVVTYEDYEHIGKTRQLVEWLKELKELREQNFQSQMSGTLDSISRQAAIEAVHADYDTILDFRSNDKTIADSIEDIINTLASTSSEYTCVGCKHHGIWENEVEYGYNSPCTRCKRRANDNYEQ